MPVEIPNELAHILLETPELKQAYLVGGCVRDALLNIPNKDFDVEVFGVDYEELARGLSRWGRTDLVGRSFGTVKLTTGSGYDYDFTIPRRDSKVGPGHKGFEVQLDPAIDVREAASRRDFTINSLMFDPRGRKVLDFFGGAGDLEKKILRHTSEAFPEDPLRVLRGMQFAARFDLHAAPETIELCRKIKGSHGELAVERVREEWFKWAEKGVRPSAGLKFLAATGWIEHFPEIKALIGTPQDPEWHPEGDVFTHTCHCLDALVQLPEWQAADAESKTVYSLAVLAHDFGKPSTTHQAMKGGRMRIVSPDHEKKGGPITRSFLERIHAPGAVQRRVLPLVLNHLAHMQADTDRAVRRLAKRLHPETIQSLCIVITADHMGRPPRPAAPPGNVKKLLEKARELNVQESAPQPILLGRHLIALGIEPGPAFGTILNEAYEAQLEGTFGDLDGAYAWLKQQEHPGLEAERGL